MLTSCLLNIYPRGFVPLSPWSEKFLTTVESGECRDTLVFRLLVMPNCEFCKWDVCSNTLSYQSSGNIAKEGLGRPWELECGAGSAVKCHLLGKVWSYIHGITKVVVSRFSQDQDSEWCRKSSQIRTPCWGATGSCWLLGEENPLWFFHTDWLFMHQWLYTHDHMSITDWNQRIVKTHFRKYMNKLGERCTG